MRKKFFSLLVLLAVVATGAVAQTETLLTTITATAKEQASYSTANVATVSFSYTAYGSSAYFANWGWWGYGWSATVNAAEGYTITKCVFYDDQNRTATDSEAPFVVETTEEDKTPKVNGTPILEYTSKGIKKIDVYGYENPTTVNVTGITLSQTEAAMTVGGETLTLTATVAPDDATDKTVTWTSSDPTVATVANGVVTAVAAGTATITATATNGTPDDTTDDFSATCDVTVSAPAPQPVTDPITPYADPQDASVYYSTFYDSNFKYELPADVEAYVADLSGANLLLTKIAEAGEVIPANVAVILKSTVTSFTLTVSDADAVTFTATNDLQGSDTQIATPANCYVLAGTDGVVGFYHYTAANLNAHKAYVVYSGSNQAPRRMPFIFDQATGVENVQNSDIRSQKVVENGQLIIIRNGVRYNAAGQNVK